jgi:hypothetical protein
VVEGRCGESCSVVVLSSETDLGEPLTAGERTSRRGLIRGPEEAGVPGGNSQPCTLVILFSRTASEEPLATAEESDLGRDVGDQGRPPDRDGHPQSCILQYLLTCCGPGGAVMEVAGESPSLKRVGSRDLGRGGNRGSRRQELVTIEVRVIATLLDLGEANRGRRWCPKVPENAANQGWSRRKRPRPKRLKPRNSSGSLTS